MFTGLGTDEKESSRRIEEGATRLAPFCTASSVVTYRTYYPKLFCGNPVPLEALLVEYQYAKRPMSIAIGRSDYFTQSRYCDSNVRTTESQFNRTFTLHTYDHAQVAPLSVWHPTLEFHTMHMQRTSRKNLFSSLRERLGKCRVDQHGIGDVADL